MAKTPTGEPVPAPTDEPADTAAPAEEKPAEPEPAAEAAPALGGVYRFTGPYAQTYMDASFVAEPGDTHDWPDGPPADGRWIKEN